MNLPIILIVVALIGIFALSRKSQIDLRMPMLLLAILAIAMATVKFAGRGAVSDIPSEVDDIESAAGRMLGEAMHSIEPGPILALTWRGDGYSPDPARLQGLRSALGRGREIIYGGVYIEGMNVERGFVKLDPINTARDLRLYLEQNRNIAAVVALRPLSNWDALAGLQSPPFFVFAHTSAWRPFMDSGLVQAAVVGMQSSRETDADQPSGFSLVEYRLVQ